MSINGNIEGREVLRGSITIPGVIHGRSAYEIAVINGFRGTEAEWLESLVGVGVEGVRQTTYADESEGENVAEVILTDGSRYDIIFRNGAKGDKGEKGDKGDKGDPGADGIVGEDGKSAYQYALDGGFEGSEAEFAELLGGADARLEEIESQIADILYEAISITSFSHNGGTAVVGSTVNDITLSWKTSKTPVTLTLDGVMVNVQETSKTLVGQGITAQRTFTLKATDERGATATKTATLYFRNYIYYGAATVDAVISGIPEDTPRELSDTKARTFTVNAGEGEYIWYLLPKRLGTCSFKVGGFDGGFELFGEGEIPNDAGYSEVYYVYRSTNASLGVTTVEVK